MSVKILTFGCRLNACESETMVREAKKAGLGELEGGAVLVNSCAVTGEAVRRAKQAIRRARREHCDARIIVSGCAAQTEPAGFANMPEVDLVIGNDDKLHADAYRALPGFGLNDTEKARVNDIMAVREIPTHLAASVEGRARAFLQVQNGCDHRCTFCVIPYGRGNSRSAPTVRVVDDVQRLVGEGFKEVVLTGVDLTSWGGDLPGGPRLGDLVQAILAQAPELARLRLSSIDSVEADEALIETIAGEPRFMPHLHLSLQHGDDMILKRMKRRHSRDEAIAFCDSIRALRPDIAFGADLIAGFPTETEEMFANSMSLVEACGLTMLHVFPFSPRPGTPAARMPQLDRALVRERAARLRSAGEAALDRAMRDQIGKRHAVLIESGGIGRIPQFLAVQMAECEPGDIVEAMITGADNGMLMGKRMLAGAA